MSDASADLQISPPAPQGALQPSTINIRNLSIKCGHCDTYQTLCGFEHRGEWNVYTYECENEICDPAVTRTYLEVPAELDEFARRDPGWHGGARHGGAGGHDA